MFRFGKNSKGRFCDCIFYGQSGLSGFAKSSLGRSCGKVYCIETLGFPILQITLDVTLECKCFACGNVSCPSLAVNAYVFPWRQLYLIENFSELKPST